MPFKGITFAGQNVTPKNDGGLYRAHHGDGILWGCSMAVSGDDLVIQSGEFIAGGRVCQVDGATSVDLSDRTITNGYIQVVMDFDMSQPEGSQWNIHRPLYENPSSPTFGALTQDNINGSDTLYQIDLAIVQVISGNLSLYKERGSSSLVFYTADGGRTQIGGSSGYRSIQNFDNADNNVGGFIVDITNDRTEIYNDGGNGIYFRPMGQGDGTNTCYFDTDGFLGGQRFRRITFTGGECYQIGHFCHLNIYRNITSTPSANTWHNLIKPNEIPAPIAVTRGLGQLTLDNGNTGGAVNLRIDTSKQIQWALSSTTGSWNIFGTIDYWTNDVS